MASVKRLLLLSYLDLSDSLKPPVFDLMVFTITFMSVLIAYIQLYSSSTSLALNLFGPVLLATALYLSLRSSSGIAYLISTRQIEAYMAYPISRRSVGIALYVSRVLTPSILLILLPALAAGTVYYPLIRSEGLDYTVMAGAFIVQALFYGSVFALIAIATKNSGSASILSLVFYFTYNITALILAAISTSFQSILYKLSQAMSFYLVVYQYLVTPKGSLLHPGPAEFLFVPLATIIVTLGILEYMARRFEP